MSDIVKHYTFYVDGEVRTSFRCPVDVDVSTDSRASSGDNKFSLNVTPLDAKGQPVNTQGDLVLVKVQPTNSDLSVPYQDQVDVTLTVDTEPFENSVEEAVEEVEKLTAANVAATAAMCHARKLAARKISRSVINGFAKLILSEISQLKTEAEAKLPTLLQELTARGAACQGKQEQLTKDFQRITSHYAEMFSTMDENLGVALRNLDKPLYVLMGAINSFMSECFVNSQIGGPLVGFPEINDAETKLGVIKLKQTAVRMLQLTQRNLNYANILNRSIENMLYDTADPEKAAEEHPVFVPVVTCDHASLKEKTEVRTISTPDFISEQASVQANIEAQKQTFNIPSASDAQLSQIDMFFRKKLSQTASGKDQEKDSRINEAILRMWKNSTQKIIS